VASASTRCSQSATSSAGSNSGDASRTATAAAPARRSNNGAAERSARTYGRGGPSRRPCDRVARVTRLGSRFRHRFSFAAGAWRFAAGRALSARRPAVGPRARLVLWRDLRRRPPQHDELADLLHGRRIYRRADAFEHRSSFIAHLTEKTHLDQFVRAQIDVDFSNYRGGQPMMPDAHDRMQMMGLGAKLSTTYGSYRQHASILAHRGAGQRISARPAGARPWQPISA
jgi:hypothetical protein